MAYHLSLHLPTQHDGQRIKRTLFRNSKDYGPAEDTESVFSYITLEFPLISLQCIDHHYHTHTFPLASSNVVPRSLSSQEEI